MFTKIHLIGVEFSRDTRNLTAFELAAAAHAPFAVSLEARAIGRPFSGSTGTWTVHHHENYKRLFAFPLMVEHLLRAVEADSFDDADFSTLEKLSAEYVSDALLKRHGDTVWRLRLRLRDRWTFLLVLLECQSRDDPWMALRILTYPGLRYEELVRNEAPEVLAGRLPAALPVVLYNGANPWQAAREVGALIAPVGPRLASFQPAQRTPILLP